MKKRYILYALVYILLSLIISYSISYFTGLQFEWWNKLAISSVSLIFIYFAIKKEK